MSPPGDGTAALEEHPRVADSIRDDNPTATHDAIWDNIDALRARLRGVFDRRD